MGNLTGVPKGNESMIGCFGIVWAYLGPLGALPGPGLILLKLTTPSPRRQCSHLTCSRSRSATTLNVSIIFAVLSYIDKDDSKPDPADKTESSGQAPKLHKHGRTKIAPPNRLKRCSLDGVYFVHM